MCNQEDIETTAVSSSEAPDVKVILEQLEKSEDIYVVVSECSSYYFVLVSIPYTELYSNDNRVFVFRLIKTGVGDYLPLAKTLVGPYYFYKDVDGDIMKLRHSQRLVLNRKVRKAVDKLVDERKRAEAAEAAERAERLKSQHVTGVTISRLPGPVPMSHFVEFKLNGLTKGAGFRTVDGSDIDYIGFIEDTFGELSEGNRKLISDTWELYFSIA